YRTENFETGADNGFYNLHRHISDTANTTIGGNEVELLSEGETGAMILLRLKKGDEINISVNANYEGVPTDNTFAEISYSALYGQFNNTTIAADNSVTVNSTAFDDAISGGLNGKGTSTIAPRAYLNFIVFDTAMNYVNAGFTQVTAAAQGIGVHETLKLDTFKADTSGYILIYLSNESTDADVHFDDLTVHQQQTGVVQADDYYPFGLTFNSYQAPGARENRFKYNSFEFMEDLNLNLYDYQARYYDPAIGRFIQVDPAADLMRRHSVYNYAFDNPIRFVDPDGMVPVTTVPTTMTGGGGGGGGMALFGTVGFGTGEGGGGASQSGDKDDYVFDANGRFTGEIIDTGDDIHRIVVQQEDGSETIHELNDPVNDSKTLEALTTYHPDEQLIFNKSEQDIDGYLDEVGVEEMSFLDRIGFAWDKSRTGPLDFPETLRFELLENSGIDPEFIQNDASGFFILNNQAYNTSDAGNFIWGRAMNRLGFGLRLTLFGANVHNALFDPNPGLLDSSADQKAIQNGHGGNN
ncbi:MAG: RHS repeat-associated core domain-containing protein, partial [Ekhidna sp.]